MSLEDKDNVTSIVNLSFLLHSEGQKVEEAAGEYSL